MRLRLSRAEAGKRVRHENGKCLWEIYCERPFLQTSFQIPNNFGLRRKKQNGSGRNLQQKGGAVKGK